MLAFLLGLIGYICAWFFYKWLGTKRPGFVRTLEEWALPTITVLLIVGIWMVL